MPKISSACGASTRSTFPVASVHASVPCRLPIPSLVMNWLPKTMSWPPGSVATPSSSVHGVVKTCVPAHACGVAAGGGGGGAGGVSRGAAGGGEGARGWWGAPWERAPRRPAATAPRTAAPEQDRPRDHCRTHAHVCLPQQPDNSGSVPMEPDSGDVEVCMQCRAPGAPRFSDRERHVPTERTSLPRLRTCVHRLPCRPAERRHAGLQDNVRRVAFGCPRSIVRGAL